MARSVFLREQAARCGRLARATNDGLTQERLFKLAVEYDTEADTEDGEQAPDLRARRDDA
jgi:hypothetical protein